MKKKTPLIFCLISLVIYTSCTTTTGQIFDENKSVFVTNNHIMTILPTAVYLNDMEILQQIDGDYDGQKYLMQTVLVLNPDEISISAFSTLGNSVYDLQYKNDIINYNSIVKVSGNSAVYMVADVQLCYYPQDSVKEMVEQAGLQFIQIEMKNGWNRQVLDGENKIISITRNGKSLEFQNLLRNYNYIIEEL